MIGDALAATISDLAIGLLVICALAIAIGVLLIGEARIERRRSADEDESEYVDPWASLPPRWRGARAESHLGKTKLGERSDRRPA